MANVDLTKYGITGTTEIVHNPSYETLFEEETKAGLEGYEVGKETELVAELFLSKILNCCPNILFHWMVVVWILRCIPPYCVLRILVHNDIFIFRRQSLVQLTL